MSAGTFNFTIEQGTTFQEIITWQTVEAVPQPIDLTGFTARMQIRGADGTLYTELSTSNGKISISGPEGQITLNLSDTETSAFKWKTGSYQLELTSAGGIVTRLLKGTVTIDPEVTI